MCRRPQLVGMYLTNFWIFSLILGCIDFVNIDDRYSKYYYLLTFFRARFRCLVRKRPMGFEEIVTKAKNKDNSHYMANKGIIKINIYIWYLSLYIHSEDLKIHLPALTPSCYLVKRVKFVTTFLTVDQIRHLILLSVFLRFIFH